MNTIVSPGIKKAMDAIHFFPAASIIMPFEPKMCLKENLMRSLKVATDTIERELEGNYPDDMCMLVMQKLRDIVKNLNYDTNKSSIAIYVSPVFEKVLYLNIPVEERILVDESFEIRDLVCSKKQLHKYLVLQISGKESRIYLGESNSLVRIVSNTPENIYSNVNDLPQLMANISDRNDRKEIMIDKFLHQIDNSLAIILNAYQLPLFVLGAESILGHFKGFTRHSAAIIEYVQGFYEDATQSQIKEIMQEHIANWQLVKQKSILKQLDDAVRKNKLAIGMKEVWREAMGHKGRLLVVEKNYRYTANHGSEGEGICGASELYNKFSYLKDVVDSVIEKVLENGGDVEFVDDELLKGHDHIALIQYY